MYNYIYKFINYENEIIYVGKTSDIKKRMKQHFSSQAHLPKECYEQVFKIYYANVTSQYNAELLETYFINKHHPLFNTDKKYKENEKDICVNLIEPDWKEFLFLKTKTKNNLPNIEFLESNPIYLNKKLMFHECFKEAFRFNFSKINYYEYEFKHLCPNVINIIGFKQLKNLYEYAQSNLNTIESNIDEHVGSTAEEQIEENYIAFNMGKIKELSKILPDFDIMLKCGLVENLAENIFIIRFLTPDFLRKIEKNYKRG